LTFKPIYLLVIMRCRIGIVLLVGVISDLCVRVTQRFLQRKTTPFSNLLASSIDSYLVEW